MKTLDAKFLIFLILLVTLTFLSCHKENGKHKYLLTLDFDNYPDNATFEYYAFEKVKNYKQSYAPSKDELRKNTGGLFLCSETGIKLMLRLTEGSVKRGEWSNMNYFEFTDQQFPINSIPVDEDNRFKGQLSLGLSYRKEGREIIAENTNSSICLFTFIWQNAAEYGHTDSIFYGKCSLLRVE